MKTTNDSQQRSLNSNPVHDKIVELLKSTNKNRTEAALHRFGLAYANFNIAWARPEYLRQSGATFTPVPFEVWEHQTERGDRAQSTFLALAPAQIDSAVDMIAALAREFEEMNAELPSN